MTRVKICGLTSAGDALAAAEAGADFLGFVFAESPRRADPEKVRAFRGDLPPNVPVVAVFRDQTIEEVERVAAAVRPDCLQLHGAEVPGFGRLFGLPVIRALSVRSAEDLGAADAWADVAAFYLVDLPKGEGGVLPLEAARLAGGLPKPAFLAGGLDPENVGALVAACRPFGVDVARGVEVEPGRKDPARMRAFVARAKGGE